MVQLVFLTILIGLLASSSEAATKSQTQKKPSDPNDNKGYVIPDKQPLFKSTATLCHNFCPSHKFNFQIASIFVSQEILLFFFKILTIRRVLVPTDLLYAMRDHCGY